MDQIINDIDSLLLIKCSDKERTCIEIIALLDQLVTNNYIENTLVEKYLNHLIYNKCSFTTQIYRNGGGCVYSEIFNKHLSNIFSIYVPSEEQFKFIFSTSLKYNLKMSNSYFEKLSVNPNYKGLDHKILNDQNINPLIIFEIVEQLAYHNNILKSIYNYIAKHYDIANQLLHTDLFKNTSINAKNFYNIIHGDKFNQKINKIIKKK